MQQSENNISLSFDDLELGDLVDFAIKSFQFGLSETKITKDNVTTTYKNGNTKMYSPAMVITEIVREDSKNAHLQDEQTGRKKRDPIKVHCKWYSEKNGKFNERWLNIGMLVKSKFESAAAGSITTFEEIDIKKLEINKPVILKTYLAANTMATKIFENAIQEESASTKYHITRKYDTLTFHPPIMYVTDIVALKDNEKKPLFHKSELKLKVRKQSTHKVKCMWYDYVTGKFSEDFFYPESLLLIKKNR